MSYIWHVVVRPFSLTGACPGCSYNPTTATFYPSDEGGFVPIYTDKLVIVGSSQQPMASDAALAGISITVIAITGVLTVVVSIFTVWLLYTIYVKDCIWRRRHRASQYNLVWMYSSGLVQYLL